MEATLNARLRTFDVRAMGFLSDSERRVVGAVAGLGPVVERIWIRCFRWREVRAVPQASDEVEPVDHLEVVDLQVQAFVVDTLVHPKPLELAVLGKNDGSCCPRAT